MTLTELRYIIALDRAGHFGQAAQACFVSQPTLSVAVKKLEQQLGIAIFERSKSRVSATPIGRKIIQQAEVILEQVGVLEELALTGKDQMSAPLGVGAIFTIAPYLFPYFLPKLQELAPDMTLRIEESYTGSLRRKLREGELDAIIIALPFTETDVVTKPLYDEPFLALLPANHKLAQQDEIEPDQLMNEHVLLLGEGHCFRDQVLQMCPGLADAQKKHRHTTVEGSLETLKHMVASDMGITVLPQSAVGSLPYSQDFLVTRPFAGIAPKRTVALAWRASFPRHKAIDALYAAVQACPIAASR